MVQVYRMWIERCGPRTVRSPRRDQTPLVDGCNCRAQKCGLDWKHGAISAVRYQEVSCAALNKAVIVQPTHVYLQYIVLNFHLFYGTPYHLESLKTVGSSSVAQFIIPAVKQYFMLQPVVQTAPGMFHPFLNQIESVRGRCLNTSNESELSI